MWQVRLAGITSPSTTSYRDCKPFANFFILVRLFAALLAFAVSFLHSGLLPLSAKMLLWVNIVTDVVPASALAADPAVPQVIDRRP
jgi:Ca2+-transporting ATPase